MKKQYDNLVKILEKGFCVVVKDLSDNSYCSILNHKDINGDYRISGWWSSIERSKKWSGCHRGYSKEDWDNKDLKIVEVFRPEEKAFKVGDEVRISDKIKETGGWEGIKDNFPEMKGEIEKIYNYVSGKYYDINGWSIGQEYLIPLVEEQEDNVALEAIKLLEEKGYKIVKK